MKKTIVVVTLGLSLILNAEFIRNDLKNIVVDTKTGLQWQDYLHPTRDNFSEAVNYCYTLNHGGYTDWRLPNINEYITLTDYNTHGPAVSREFAYIYSSEGYLSSTKSATSSAYKWFYYTDKGHVGKGQTYYSGNYDFFCVRAGQ